MTEVDFVGDILHYGLIFGAIFQIIAIAAIFVLPSHGSDNNLEDINSNASRLHVENQSKKIKHEKKKKR